MSSWSWRLELEEGRMMNAVRRGDVPLFCKRRNRSEHKPTGYWKRNARGSPESCKAATKKKPTTNTLRPSQSRTLMTYPFHFQWMGVRDFLQCTFISMLTYSLCHYAARATTHSSYYLPCINVMKTLFATAYTSYHRHLYIYNTNTTINLLLVLLLL